MTTNHYGDHPFMIDSGTFWRCRHGSAPRGECWRCGVWHPVRFLRSALRGLWRRVR